MQDESVYRRILAHFDHSPARLARAIGAKSTAAVCMWAKRGVPADKAKQIESLTGISVVELRPHDWQDYWPDARKAEHVR